MCVGTWRNNKVEIIPNDIGEKITPSYVAWNPETCERMIGDAAKNQLTTNPHNTVSINILSLTQNLVRLAIFL